MADSFLASDLFRFVLTVGGITVSAGLIIAGLRVRDRARTLEVVTMVTFGIGGFSSIVSFVMHFFFSDAVAASIGWPMGSPFQKEVAGANLAVGILGFGCFWRRDFWLPYALSKGAFLWVAGITHVVDLAQNQNLAVGNAGLTLYMDFLRPVIYALLLWLVSRYGKPAPPGLTYTVPQL
jgi:hypothetical protein